LDPDVFCHVACASCSLKHVNNEVWFVSVVHKSVADRGDRLVQPNALHDGGICPKCIPVILQNPAVCDSTGEIAYRPYITRSAVGYFHFARLFSSISMLFRFRYTYIVSSRRLGPMTKVPNFLCPSSSDILDPPL